MSKARDFLLTDSFEVKGVWYLPGKEMSKDGVEGFLRYTPQRIELDLIGTLDSLDSFSNNESIHHSTIYGFSDCGEWFTLIECFPRKARMNVPGFDTMSYIVNRFFAGTDLIECEESAIIKNVEFSFTNIDAWLNYTMLQRVENKARKRSEIILDANFLDKKSIQIQSQRLVLNEEFGYRIVPAKDFFLAEKLEVVIRRFYRFSPDADDLLTPNQLFDNIQKVRRLLVLLIGSAMYFSHINFNLPSTKEVGFGGEEFERKHSCKLFFNQVGDIFKTKHLSPHAPHSMLIKRNDIVKNMEQIFNTWFNEQDGLSEITSACISDLYLPAYMESNFLNVVRGLETYHRFFVEHNDSAEYVNESNVDKLAEERSVIIDFINANISDENINYFTARVLYEERQSLRKRLNELLIALPPKLSKFLFKEMSSKERNKLVTTIIDTRNYYTHRDEKTKYPNAVKNHKVLNDITRQLSSVLQFYCLTFIGVDPQIAEQRLIEHN